MNISRIGAIDLSNKLEKKLIQESKQKEHHEGALSVSVI